MLMRSPTEVGAILPRSATTPRREGRPPAEKTSRMRWGNTRGGVKRGDHASHDGRAALQHGAHLPNAVAPTHIVDELPCMLVLHADLNCKRIELRIVHVHNKVQIVIAFLAHDLDVAVALARVHRIQQVPSVQQLTNLRPAAHDLSHVNTFGEPSRS